MSDSKLYSGVKELVAAASEQYISWVVTAEIDNRLKVGVNKIDFAEFVTAEEKTNSVDVLIYDNRVMVQKLCEKLYGIDVKLTNYRTYVPADNSDRDVIPAGYRYDAHFTITMHENSEYYVNWKTRMAGYREQLKEIKNKEVHKKRLQLIEEIQKKQKELEELDN